MSKPILPGKTNARITAAPSLAVSITAESDALAAATVANWLNVQSWRTTLGKRDQWDAVGNEQYFTSYPQFEIDIECDASETLTGTPKLYACRLGPVTVADDTFTSSSEVHTATSHAMLRGDGPFQLTTSDTLPAGLSLLTDYYVGVLADANSFELHTTRAGAIADDATTLVTTTDGGTGTHTIADKQSQANSDDDTRRFRFALVGDLNDGSDIVVAAQTSYMERINHSPLDLYYVVVATETGAQTVTIRLTPVMALEV